MNGSTKIQPTHRQRQAVIYLRQSTPKQVLKNRESALNQRALRGRLLDLGWCKDQIVLIDEDQARSARQAAGARDSSGWSPMSACARSDSSSAPRSPGSRATVPTGTGCWNCAPSSTP